MTYETDAYGCHIVIRSMPYNRFDVSISYDVYNDLGERIANPTHGNVGSSEAMYLFLLTTIARAVKHNKQSIILDLPMLEIT